jgi:DNA-binding response OmpR family regulator
MRIAVLDDDQSQTDLVCQVLTAAGHNCHPFQSGKALVKQLRRELFDMLVIDWKVPDMSGPEVLQWAREKLPPTLPIMFMTSQSREEDIVSGFAAGADDYMVKPVNRGELLARVQALLRRPYPSQNEIEQIKFDNYIFEPRAFRVTIGDLDVEVTQKEFALGLLFFRNLGRPLSRAYILEAVWSRDVDIPSRTMDTHVSRVRSKFQLRPENGYRLTPVYSYGYRLEQVSAQD